MNRILLFTIILFFATTVGAQQNYVPNGDFEYYSQCPYSHSQMQFATGWRAYTSGTPDYISTCATFWGISVPSNAFGYQQPASGQAYVGIYAAGGMGEYKEYITRQITPLTVGGEYEFSMSVSVADSAVEGTSDLGAYFYNSGPNFVSTVKALQVTPQIIFTKEGILKDTVNWVRLTGIFVATQPYDNIVIGSFIDSNTRTIFDPPPDPPAPFYYIDSVVVKLLDTFDVKYTDTLLCAGDAIQVKYWARLHTTPGTIVTMQLSDANGSFAQPVDIGSDTTNKSGLITCRIPANTPSGKGYRIRAVSTYNSEVSVDNEIDIKIVNVDNLVAANNGPVCYNDTLRLTATQDTSGATYTWTGPGFGSVKQNPVRYNPVKANAGDYIVTAKIYRCTRSDTTTVEVLDGNRAKNVKATGSSPVCVGDSVLLNGDSDTGPFVYAWTGPASYRSDGKEDLFTAIDTTASGWYVFSATDRECIVKDSVNVKVNPLPMKPELTSNSPVGVRDILSLQLLNPTPGASVVWTGPGGFKSTSPQPNVGSLTIDRSGKYFLTTELNGCSDSSSIEVFIYDIKDTNKIVLYPNPNDGSFTIEGLMQDDKAIPIAVYSSMGMRIHKQDLIPVNKILSEKVTLKGKLSSGVYYAELFVNRKTVIIPFTVVK